MSETKISRLGRVSNTICAFSGIIIYLILINTSASLPEAYRSPFNMIMLISAINLFVGIITINIYPQVFRFVIVALYGVFVIYSLFINNGNNILYQLMMLTMGLVSLFKKRSLLVASFIIDILISLLSYILADRLALGFSNVFLLRDFFINNCILVVEFVAFNLNLDSFIERHQIDMESTQTVDELIKVVAAKREAAIRANHSKSDFLASMSHEIRTPINAVLGFNEMILRESRVGLITEYARDIKSSGTSLLGLVNDILDFSKIEAGKMEIIPVVYALDNMLNDLINIIGIRAQEKGLSLRVKADPSLPRELYGDEIRIKQVIVNLLTNGVKYTDKGSVTLVIDYEKLDDFQIELKISVEDTGRGIREEDMDKLFAPFERLDEISNRHVEGTGLGIALTRTLLHLMGSHLEVDSTFGLGSNFSFALRQEVENWAPLGSLDEAIGRAKSDVVKSRNSFVAPLARVLAVDDIPINLKVLTSLLKRAQVEVDTASSGMEALSLMRKNKYDIIFLDHMMPEMDGIETLERMNSDRFNLNRFETPVIALTANAVSGAREMYMEKGFSDYVTKPTDGARLETILLKYLDPELIVTMEDEDDSTGTPTAADANATPTTAAATGTPVAADANDIPAAAAGASETLTADEAGLEALKHIASIDVAAGVKASGSEEIFLEVIRDYYETIDEYSGRIESFMASKDLPNYRIQVHSLKSTSRMAGAMEISEIAAELEHAADENDMAFITDVTPGLLQMYRDLKNQLAKVFREDSAPKDKIDKETFFSALNAIKDGVELFDYDLIESVMSELNNSEIPAEYQSVYERMKVLISDVNTDGLGELIESTLKQQGN